MSSSIDKITLTRKPEFRTTSGEQKTVTVSVRRPRVALEAEAVQATEVAPPKMPRLVQARFVEESFAGMDEELVAEVKAAYQEGAATLGSAGIDLRYVGADPLTIYPGDQAMVNTGLSIYLKDPTLVGLIMPRSGLGSKGLVLGNLTGVIDSDYQGEIMLTLWNRNESWTEQDITIQPGERIAQYLVSYRPAVALDFVEAFDEVSMRGAGGFGHTGQF